MSPKTPAVPNEAIGRGVHARVEDNILWRSTLGLRCACYKVSFFNDSQNQQGISQLRKGQDLHCCIDKILLECSILDQHKHNNVTHWPLHSHSDICWICLWNFVWEYLFVFVELNYLYDLWLYDMNWLSKLLNCVHLDSHWMQDNVRRF